LSNRFLVFVLGILLGLPDVVHDPNVPTKLDALLDGRIPLGQPLHGSELSLDVVLVRRLGLFRLDGDFARLRVAPNLHVVLVLELGLLHDALRGRGNQITSRCSWSD
jgi:hypothetical protein